LEVVEEERKVVAGDDSGDVGVLQVKAHNQKVKRRSPVPVYE